jgi:hypothetical protein
VRALGYFGAPEKPATSHRSSALMSAPFDITQRVRRMADVFGDRMRRVRRCLSAEVAIRIVSELCQIPLEPPLEQRDLPRHSDAHRCCGKSLMGTALVGFGVG